MASYLNYSTACTISIRVLHVSALTTNVHNSNEHLSSWKHSITIIGAERHYVRFLPLNAIVYFCESVETHLFTCGVENNCLVVAGRNTGTVCAAQKQLPSERD